MELFMNFNLKDVIELDLGMKMVKLFHKIRNLNLCYI
jgi:hypothetical protein